MRVAGGSFLGSIQVRSFPGHPFQHSSALGESYELPWSTLANLQTTALGVCQESADCEWVEKPSGAVPSLYCLPATAR